MLAAARLGAPHVVVFAEYSADVLASFMADAETLVTADGYHQNGAFHLLGPKANHSIEQLEWDVTTVRSIVLDTIAKAGAPSTTTTPSD